MWVKSDKWGTINWGQLSQATDRVALLPDLSGTVIESQAVVFDGAGMFIRPKGAKNSNDLLTGDFTWGQLLHCLGLGFGIGADCNGYPDQAIRYDSPTWCGFSMSTSYGEDDMWDVAVKYAADWNSVKVSAAVGYSQLTDEGCLASAIPVAPTSRSSAVVARPQGYRNERRYLPDWGIDHARAVGPVVYGMCESEQNDGTRYVTSTSTLTPP